MCRKKRFDTLKYGIFAVIIALITVLGMCCVTPLAFADSIENTGYTNVLDDLQKDENFDISKYSENTEDNSLQVTQIAESTENTLFVYVYQPSGQVKDLRASLIRFSTGINDNAKYLDYSLEFINSNETLYKYKLLAFEVLQDALRYYDITAIFRPWNKDLDESTGNDNTTEQVSYTVGKLYTVSTVDGVVSYTCEVSETIEIIDEYRGTLRYLNGFWFGSQSCDSHFVAFNTNRQIDNLLEADVTYTARSYTRTVSLILGERWTYGDPETKIAELTNTQSVDGVGFANAGWSRIQTIAEFITGEDLTDETKNNIKNCKYVLRFLETDYSKNSGSGSTYENGVQVTNVSILRLKFDANDETFNLGVVDDYQSSDLEPDNNYLPDWLLTLIRVLVGIVIGVLAVVLIVVLFPYIIILFTWLFKALFLIFKYIFIGLWYVIKYIALGIWYLIASPYYIFKWIQNK